VVADYCHAQTRLDPTGVEQGQTHDYVQHVVQSRPVCIWLRLATVSNTFDEMYKLALAHHANSEQELSADRASVLQWPEDMPSPDLTILLVPQSPHSDQRSVRVLGV
jgi:hypothetical protein